MKHEYSVEITKVAEEMMLEPVNLPDDIATRVIIRNDVSRPGLPLAGFFDHFESGRIQIIGNMEHKYIELLTHEQRMEALERFLSCGVVCIVVTRGLDIFPELSQLCEKYGTPLYLSHDTTSNFMAALIAYLNVQLAERITKHGVLIEVYGEGILMLGDSGIGKSETAIELVKRGHRLIADDAVEIKKVSNKTLVGAAPELIRHYVELRGIGLVDVRRIFGMGAVKLTEKIDLVVNLELWQQGKMYERLGLDDEYEEILGLKIPSIVLPVKPGRNLAVVIEIAAMNNRQKKMGYNTAAEFNKKYMQLLEQNNHGN